ncbi:MAG: NUDIX hydrolase [Parcubacteria group bacterium]
MDKPGVGVGVIIRRENRVLLGKRKNSHGDGTWSFPGGKLDLWETPEECAVREVEEETGLKIKNITKSIYTNDLFREEGKHFITLFFIGDYDGGEAELREPDKCESWEWFEWDKLPEPLFYPLKNYIEQGISPFQS